MKAPWRWEFWPFWLFYLPVYPLPLTAAIRTGRLALLTCANPGIVFGGLLDYSKFDLMRRLPPHRLPRTVVVDGDVATMDALAALDRAGIEFPIIAKPDRGERGFMVEKVESPDEMSAYLERFAAFSAALRKEGLSKDHERVLLQSYVDLPHEYDAMYVHGPFDDSGRITSIVAREFLEVAGDGERTLRDLVA